MMHTTVPIGFRRHGEPIYPIAGGSETRTAGSQQGTPPDPAPSGQGQGEGQGSGQGSGQAQGQGQGGHAGQGQGSGQGSQGDQPAVSSDKGFPEGVPLEQMTAEQREAYWKHYARQHEQRNKDLLALANGSYDELKQKVEGYEQLRQQQMTEHEQAVEQAKQQARTKTLSEVGGKLVAAEIRAHAAGRLDDDKLTTLVNSLNHEQFLTDTGDVDTDRVKSLVDGIVPADGAGNSSHPNLGQGRRQGQPSDRGIEAGRERARQRHPELTQQQQQ
jgi:hypothetical protein